MSKQVYVELACKVFVSLATTQSIFVRGLTSIWALKTSRGRHFQGGGQAAEVNDDLDTSRLLIIGSAEVSPRADSRHAKKRAKQLMKQIGVSDSDDGFWIEEGIASGSCRALLIMRISGSDRIR